LTEGIGQADHLKRDGDAYHVGRGASNHTTRSSDAGSPG
jgi:hypothetical protein